MSKIPTQRVILKASGDEVIINVSDYNEELHGPISKRAEARQAKSEAKRAAADIVSLNATDAKAAIEATDDLASLDELQNAEEASEKYEGGRAGVLAAISERRAELKAKE